jgi:N-acetylmuramoyl-L-alanine amidase
MRHSCNSALFFGLIVASATVSQAAEPGIVSRNAWQAEAPSAPMKKQVPRAILVHHTGTPQKPKTTLESKLRGLQRFSQAKEKLADGRSKPAWPDVPYHFYIAVDGRIGEGRDVNAVGDTNTGYDPAGFIQVVVEGNFETESPTKAQTTALKSLLQTLKLKYNIKAASILGHNDKAQTICPGKNLLAELPEIVKGLE